MDKHLKNKQKQLKTKEQKQVDVLKSLESSEKQLPAIKDFISKERLNPEFMSELERSEDEENITDRSNMVHKGYDKTYYFRNFKRIHAFGDDIKTNFINMANN